MDIEVGGFLGLIILVLNVWAILKVFQSKASNASKVFWVVLILILPVFGLILWFLAGPKGEIVLSEYPFEHLVNVATVARHLRRRRNEMQRPTLINLIHNF
jgi:hypothetical protein